MANIIISDLDSSILTNLSDEETKTLAGGAAGAVGGAFVGAASATYAGWTSGKRGWALFKDQLVYAGIGAVGGGLAGSPGGPATASLSSPK